MEHEYVYLRFVCLVRAHHKIERLFWLQIRGINLISYYYTSTQFNMSNITSANKEGGAGYNTNSYYNEHREKMLNWQKGYHEQNHDTYLQNQKIYYQRTKVNKLKLAKTIVHCEYCKKDMTKGGLWGHNKSKNHLKNKQNYLLTISTYEKVEGETIVYKPLTFT